VSNSVASTIVTTAVGIPACVINASRASPVMPIRPARITANIGATSRRKLTPVNIKRKRSKRANCPNCKPSKTSIKGIAASRSSCVVRSIGTGNSVTPKPLSKNVNNNARNGGVFNTFNRESLIEARPLDATYTPSVYVTVVPATKQMTAQLNASSPKANSTIDKPKFPPLKA